MAATLVLDRGFNGYRQMDQTEMGAEENGIWRSFSRRKTSLSYRQDRARRRQIFLKTYKLSTMETLGGSNDSSKLKKVMVKVKAVMASIVSIARIGTLKSCNSRSAICASTPGSAEKFF